MTLPLSLPPFLSSIVGWLRAGYPDGVPENDYVPLLSLLARRLTSDEVAAVATELGREGAADSIDSVDIGTVITKITNELPRQEDVARVRSRLDSAGPFV
jgi:hypothetical protein